MSDENKAAPPVVAGEYDGLITRLYELSTLDYLPQDQAMKEAADALAAMQARVSELEQWNVTRAQELVTQKHEQLQGRMVALAERDAERKANREAQARIAALTEALHFYGNAELYSTIEYRQSGPGTMPTLAADKGMIARAALNGGDNV